MRNSVEEDDKSSQHTMQLASASFLPMAMKAAALELGVLEIIEKAGPGALLSASQVASELKAQNRDAPLVLDRLLRLLSAHSVLTFSVSHSQSDGKALRLYRLSPVSKYFVPNHEGASMAPLTCFNGTFNVFDAGQGLHGYVVILSF